MNIRRELERGIDGMVGRMMSWWTQAPVRPLEPYEPEDEPRDSVVARVEEPEKQAPAAVEEKAAAAPAPSPASPPAPASSPPADLDPILEALSQPTDDAGSSMKELRSRTGESAPALRKRLNQWIAEGKVQRRGQGMRTRYHLVEK